MKRKILILITNILVVSIVLFHSTGMINISALDKLENYFYDLRVNLTSSKGLDERVVIVDIDERSLRHEGHWPWSRNKLANLTNTLFDRYGAAALGYDVVFAERDEDQGIVALHALANSQGDPGFVSELSRLTTQLDRDQGFASSMEERPVVLGYYFNTNPQRNESSGQLPAPLQFDFQGSLFPPTGSSYGANIPVLQAAAYTAGFFSNPLIADDGIVRRVPTVHEFDGNLYDSFAVAVVRSYVDMDVEPVLADTDLDTGYPGMEGIYVGPFYVPIDVNGGTYVPFRGGSGSFPYVSATDILKNNVENEGIFRDAIVLVGTTSLGLADIRATPVQATFPGVEIHANIIAGILDESFKQKPTWVWGAELFILITIGIIMMLISPFLGPVRLWLVSFVVIGTIVGGNYYAWDKHNLILPLANSVALVVVLYILNVMYGFFAEAKQKRQVKNAFSHYLAPTLVNQLMDDPSMLRLSGESRELTLLFTDIAGFTTFTEQNTPETLVSILNEYLGGMCSIAISHGGTIDKIIGDALVVMFNAPLDQPTHASQAASCALEMDQFCCSFTEDKNNQGYEFGITRIGVNTGTAIVGNFGGTDRFDYTALGDTINTAARMENVNKHLGTRICISGSTVEQCPGMDFRPIGELILKGKTEAIAAYEPVSAEMAGSNYLADYLRAYKLLEQGSGDARKVLESLLETTPDDPLVKLHHGRILEGKVSAKFVMDEK